MSSHKLSVIPGRRPGDPGATSAAPWALDCRVKPGNDERGEARWSMARRHHLGGRAVNNNIQALQARRMSILPLSRKGRGLSATALGAIAAKSFGGKGEGDRLTARNVAVIPTPALPPQGGGRNKGNSTVSVPHAYVIPRKSGASRFCRRLLIMRQCQRYPVRASTPPAVVGMTILETDIHTRDQKVERGLMNEFVREVYVSCWALCSRAG